VARVGIIMEKLNTKNSVISGLFWKLMERGGTQGIQFIVQIVLARLLIPEDFGVIALITIFLAIASVFVECGFSTALVQKNNSDATDFSSVFYLSLSVAGLLYVGLFFTAPFIAEFYKEPQLISVIRILSITLFFGAVNSIQYAIVLITMQFKRLFFSSLGGIIPSGIVGITMAYMGLGVWALVWQQLTNQLLITLILWFTVKWRPKLICSIDRLKILFSFSWKLLCSALLDTIYNNLYGLVIGKVYDSAMLGYYNRGNTFPSLIVTNIDGAIGSVMFPVLSANQDDKSRVKAMVRRSIVTSSFFIFPMMIGLAVCAVPLVRILLTDKWLPCVPLLQLMCLSYAFWPIHTANLQAINALGRSDIFLKLELIKKGIGLFALCIGIPFGVYVMVALKVVTSFIGTLVNAFPNKKLLDYSYKQQWLDIMPSILISLITGSAVYSIKFFCFSDLLTLIIQLGSGTVIYIGLALIFKLECFAYLLDTVKDMLRKKNKRNEGTDRSV
jgi:teichuronic acid exporter